MVSNPTIGGHSRWFRLAVLFSLLFVLFASMLAVGAVDGPGPSASLPGQGGDGNLSSLGDSSDAQNISENGTNQSAEQAETEQNATESTDSPGESGESSGTDGSQPGDSGAQGSEGGTGSGGFGALNPGESTGVGGDTGFDEETFASNDTSVHFRVVSSQPSYWRTGSYDTYTGTGWERPESATPYGRPINHEGPVGERIEYQVTLEQPASALPTAWRPRTVSGVENLRVTDDGAFRSQDILEPGTTFAGVSHRSVRDPGLLRSTGQDYPDEIVQRYTQLPADTPERVGQFTSDLTADDDTAFDTAVTVQNWLRSSKDYSLEASQRSSHMADTFIFEMDVGYCEYFATSMVAMLRSQDIPSRYVVGYSTGQKIDANTYELRGMNAHAWVEVYFEGVGWVQFDPTPSSPRQDVQQEALNQGTGEGGQSGESTETDDSSQTGEDDNSSQTGQETTDGESGQEDSESEQNGGDSSNGEDSESGEEGTDSENDTGDTGDSQSQDGDNSGSESGDGGNQDGDGQEGEQSEEEQSDEEEKEQEQTNEDEEDETIPGPPYDITVSPEPFPGQSVTVTVEKNGTPVQGVEVSFNDELAGTTDAAGKVEGTVPYANEVIVSVRPPRDESASLERFGTGAGGSALSGGFLFAPATNLQSDTNSSVRYQIPTNVTVETQEIVVPDRTVSANMSLNGSAVAGLDVIVDGETVGTTDENGNFTLPIPADVTLGEDLPVRFERDEFLGEGNVTVADVEIEIDAGFLKLPGMSADVTVTAVDEQQEIPLEEVPVRVNGGAVVDVTDGNGTAAMTLPWSNEGTATAIVGENTVSASVSGMLFHLLAVVAVPVGALIGAGVWFRRNPERVRRFKRRTIGALVTAGEWIRRIGHQVYSALGVLRRRLLTLADRVRNYFARLREGITLAALLSPVRYLAALASGFVAWILALPGLIRGLLSDDPPEHTEVEGLGSESEDTGSAAGEATERIPAYRRLRQCWRWLVRRVVRQSRTKTAVEVEQRAVEKGLPLRPVRRLRRAFQDVEYGFAEPDERVDVAEESVEQLREDTEDPEQ